MSRPKREWFQSERDKMGPRRVTCASSLVFLKMPIASVSVATAALAAPVSDGAAEKKKEKKKKQKKKLKEAELTLRRKQAYVLLSVLPSKNVRRPEARAGKMETTMMVMMMVKTCFAISATKMRTRDVNCCDSGQKS